MKKNIIQKETSRRSLIKAGAAVICAGAAASHAAPAPAKARFDKIYDVIVVGSGFAALAAALRAREQGAHVLLIEKMPAFGGNSAINGGAFAVAGSPLQEKSGIKDSPELMLKDMIRSGRGLSHVDLLKMIVEGTRPAFDWVVSYGVKFKPFVQHFGGHSVPRIMQTVESTGGGITRPLAEACLKKGVEMHRRAMMRDFIRSADGRVIGLKVREGYIFPKEDSGVDVTYGARRGVVMATGGFSRNIWFRSQQDPLLDSRLDSTNQPGATGEGLLKMLAIGGAPVQLDQIQLGPWSSPEEKGFGLVSQFNTIAGFPMGIMVDPRTGRRFCNELADRKERADKILTMIENGKPVYPICFTDTKGVAKAQTLKNGLKYGVIHKFDSLEAIARGFHMPVEAFVAQVKEFNGYVRAKDDKQFHRPLQLAIVLDKPPFYAVKVWPKVHYCMGGVGINPKAEVLDVMGRPIPGLFAAGEVTGGAHGASRLGGCAIADGLCFGRIAGLSAASSTPVDL
ncbi:flavocytochrome c [Mesosutterella sp. OilRF-GAM-744-9]|uniref:Flavocytochrome c n=2 Tax=Mesosutterella TaxID=2494213 RepID=A0ABS9MQE4_9BURK|nr:MULTISPECIES: flavocytochrome c [unclassified Mesosutterella]MCG5030480.1 flavocytochrome c [Mesosutterella sp. oilRF-744-WT-GAM-9]MCI6530905.1 flavocytochrome c [Mesosutterella sp.]MDL2059378.1 flavocytochrome c [Mesosutterella sp. AGMB02718]